MKLPLMFRALASLEETLDYGRSIQEDGMASINWRDFDNALHEANDVINETDEHVMSFVEDMNNLRHALSLLIAQQDLWPLILRDTRDSLSAGHQALHKSPILNAQAEE